MVESGELSCMETIPFHNHPEMKFRCSLARVHEGPHAYMWITAMLVDGEWVNKSNADG